MNRTAVTTAIIVIVSLVIYDLVVKPNLPGSNYEEYSV